MGCTACGTALSLKSGNRRLIASRFRLITYAQEAILQNKVQYFRKKLIDWSVNIYYFARVGGIRTTNRNMKKPCDTKEKLLQVGFDLIWDSSYGSVSVDDICKRA